ncbi:YdcH family protein [Tepidicaulis sp. LMO-SS28]|uniref:YdcH family protein n=1 Tax=Tepidicaulis sp. LMO-SS28 TaxID=3447455 RepID=UPI003EE25C79
MNEADEEDLRSQLVLLKEEHRDLDGAIHALEAVPFPDHLQIKRLKKRKLDLRDRILRIEDILFPDIIA